MAHKLQMYENLRDMLETEVGNIERKHDLNKESLDNLYKLSMSLKVVDRCIEREQMKEGEKDGSSSMDSYGRGSYGYSRGRGMNNNMSNESMMYPYYAMDSMEGGMSNARGRGNDRGSYDSYGSYEQSNRMNQNNSNEGGQSGARRGRDGDGDGRYNESRDNFRDRQDSRGMQSGDYSRDYSREGYSRDASRKKMVQKLETLMDDTMSEHERKAIQDCIEKIK